MIYLGGHLESAVHYIVQLLRRNSDTVSDIVHSA